MPAPLPLLPLLLLVAPAPPPPEEAQRETEALGELERAAGHLHGLSEGEEGRKP